MKSAGVTHTAANRTPGRPLATQHLIPDIKACDCPLYSPAQLCTLPVDPPKLFDQSPPPPSLSLQDSQNGKGKNAATAPAS